MSFEALIQKAEAVHKSEGCKAAAPLWQRAVIERPDDWRGLYGLGSAYAEAEADDAAAMAILTRAVDVSSGAPEALTALGSVLRRCQHTDTARWCYEEALKKAPDYPQAVLGMAGSYVNQGDPESGIEWARKAVSLSPNSEFLAHAENDLALLLLESGQWKEAWLLYARRSNLPHYHVREYPAPKWNGEPVKTLAIHAEQGLGDEILFASCLGEIPAEQILCEVSPRLLSLFRRSFPKVMFFGSHRELIGSGVKIDAWGRLADLPGLYRPTPDSCPGAPYIVPDPVRVASYRARLKALGDGPYIGFAWLGGTTKTHERVRRAPLDLWKSLIEKSPGTKVSLQYSEDGAWHAQKFGLAHWQAAIDDLDEFAGLVGALDLVVTSPQTATHFAGSMGRPCLVPCPSKASWGFRNGGDRMVFYRSVELVQQVGSDWNDVFSRMEQRLADLGKLSLAA